MYRKYDGFYVLKNELEDYFNNSLTISINNDNKYKIINRGYGAVFYKNENNNNQEIIHLSENSNKQAIFYGPELKKDNSNFVSINNVLKLNNISIKNRYVVLKSFYERMSTLIDIKLEAFWIGNLTIAYLKRENNYIIFYANSYGIEENKKTKKSNADIIKLLKEREKKVNKKYCTIYNAIILKDGSMAVYAADLENDNFFTNLEKKNIGHFAGDYFNSFDTALEMLKTYHFLDNNYNKNKDSRYMGFAIYCDYNENNKFSYSGAVEYKTLLSLKYVGGDINKPIWGYYFPEKTKDSSILYELNKCYVYQNIYLIYNNNFYKKAKAYANPNNAYGLTVEERNSNAEYIFLYLRYKDWSVQAICGLLGNIEQESCLNPAAWQNNTKNISLGYGLVQFTPASKFWNEFTDKNLNLTDIVVNNPEKLIEEQLEFIITHCQPKMSDNCEWLPETGVKYYDVPYYINFVDFIKSTNEPAELALVFHGNFERSADSVETRNNRCEYANKWYKYFSSYN